MMQHSAQHETYPILPVYQAITGQHIDAREGRSIPARCPIHDDRHASLSLDTIGQRWYCHACGIGGDAIELAVRSLRFCGNPYREAFRFVRDLLHLDPPSRVHTSTAYAATPRSTPAPHRRPPTQKTAVAPFRVVATLRYRFTDADGSPLYEEVRHEGVNPETGEPGKRIVLQRVIPAEASWQKEPDRWLLVDRLGQPLPCGPNDLTPITLPLRTRDGRELYPHKIKRLNHVTGLPRVLYRLPEVLAAAKNGELLAITEGPKKADLTATALQIVVTTLAGGARAPFSDEHAACFHGARHVLVFCDADTPGREAARKRAETIALHGTPVSIVDLYPDRDDGLDIADWLLQRPTHDPRRLLQLIRAYSATYQP